MARCNSIPHLESADDASLARFGNLFVAPTITLKTVEPPKFNGIDLKGSLTWVETLCKQGTSESMKIYFMSTCLEEAPLNWFHELRYQHPCLSRELFNSEIIQHFDATNDQIVNDHQMGLVTKFETRSISKTVQDTQVRSLFHFFFFLRNYCGRQSQTMLD